MRSVCVSGLGLFIVICLSLACRPPEDSGGDPTEEGKRPVPVSVFQSPLVTRNRPYPALLAKQFSAVEQTRSRLRMLTRSEKGRRLADECLSAVGSQSKKRYQGKEYKDALLGYTAACAYYRMIFTGLYYKAKVVGYQKGLRSMVQDSELVIESDPSFEEGGVYRVLGTIYMSVPAFSLSKDAVTKDLDKAYDYALKALALAPENPENLLLVGKAMWEKKRYTEAVPYFEASLERLPRKGYFQKRERDLIKENNNYLEKAQNQ